MARSTFKVLFYVNGSKEKNGVVPIMGRVTINGTVAQFSCKQSVPKTLWESRATEPKARASEYETLLKAFDRENEVFKKRVGKDRVMATYHSRVRATTK